MKTKRIFSEDRYLYNLQTKIITAMHENPSSKDGLVILEETIFFPGGGGQSCDTGTIRFEIDSDTLSDAFNVVEVFERDGEIYHKVEGIADLINDGKISSGVGCQMEINWDRRFDNMQRHCGEHILSGVFYDLYGGVNRGFHMGDEYMTIDISLEDNSEYVGKDLTWDMVMAAEEKTNQIIWQDLPVVPRHFETREEAEKMPLRKKLAIEEDITIVTIGDASRPADSVACCGTHPNTTGQVGILKIYKVEPNKGMFRVFFDAGKRAYQGYRNRFEILNKLEKDLSSGTSDLLDKYSAKQERNKEVRDRLYQLTKAVKESESRRIHQMFEDSDNDSVFVSYKILTIEDIIDVGRGLEGKIPDMLFLFHEPSNTLLLFSDKQDCGKLVKDNVAVFNGKGGGNKNFSRAIFSRPDDAEMFMDAVKKICL